MSEILGLISAAVEGIKRNRIIYETIKDPEELPEAFLEVNKQLPLAQSILEAAQTAAHAAANAGNNNLADDGESMLARISSCNKNVEELGQIFRKMRDSVEERHHLREDGHLREDENNLPEDEKSLPEDEKNLPEDENHFRKGYRDIVKKLGGEDHRVEDLMRGILDDLQILVNNQVFHLAIQDQFDKIDQAREALNVVKTSVSENNQEAGSLFVHSGNYSQFGDGDMSNVYSDRKLEDRQDHAKNDTNERIESEKKEAKWEARPVEDSSGIKTVAHRNKTQNAIEFEVDEGSKFNFLSRQIAIDRGLEIQSLDSEPLLCETVNEEVVCDEYVKLTLMSKARQPLETIFYLLPSDFPSKGLSLTKPIIGRHLARLLLQDEDSPRLMEEQSQEEDRMVEVDGSNSSFEEPDRTSTPPGASSKTDPMQKREQVLTFGYQRSYEPRETIATDTAEPYAPTLSSSASSQRSSTPTEVFSAGRTHSTKVSAPSQAGINSGSSDTASNYTSPGKEHPHAEALIRMLAQHLNEEANSFSTDKSLISAALPDLVRAYALRLGYRPRTTDERNVAFFLRKNRRRIADVFSSDEIQPDDVQHDQELERIRAQRMEQWRSQLKSHDPADIEGSDRLDDDDIPNEFVELDDNDDADDIAAAEIARYQKVMTESAEYPWLLADMRRLCTLSPGLPEDLMQKIRDTVRAVLPRDIRISEHSSMPGSKVTFAMPWDPYEFWEKEEFQEDMPRALENAVTITGSAEDAQATTVGEYMTQTWPVTAQHAIKLVKKLVNGVGTPRTASGRLPDDTSIDAQMESGRLRITATGAEDTVVEVGQQFIWLAAALRSSPYDDGVTVCLPTIREAHRLFRSSPEISVDFEFEKIDSGKQGLDRAPGFCWQDMFRNPVMVGGFPTLKKPGRGLGLEMPLRLMATLAGSERLSEFSGRTYIKGYSAMVVATAVLTNIVVWHYCFNKQGERISYGDHTLQSCPQVSMQQLTTSRHVVGWCSKCKVYAGAADASYESIGLSNAKRPPSGGVLDRINLSFGYLGIGGGAAVALCTRDKPTHYLPKDYFGMLEWVQKTHVVMWDEEAKIGWLVNGTNAILHLARAKLNAWCKSKIFADSILIEQQDVKDKGDKEPESAALTLLNEENRKLKIYVASHESKENPGSKAKPKPRDSDAGDERNDKSNDDGISWTHHLFADVVEDMINKFELLFDNQVERAARNGINLRGKIRRHLEGWDFLDVMAGSKMSLRQVTFNIGGWGWVNFARSINAVTLIGNGFGQLIRPAQSDGVCGRWQSVETGKYYLAASISDLKGIKAKSSGEIDHLLWHSPRDPFAKCPACEKLEQQDEPASSRNSNLTEQHHDPVQVFLPRTRIQDVKIIQEPQYLNQAHSDGGAVVFEDVVSPWSTLKGQPDKDLNAKKTSLAAATQPESLSNESVDVESSHIDAPSLAWWSKLHQKIHHIRYPKRLQQAGWGSTSNTHTGSASFSESAGHEQGPGSSAHDSDTSPASKPTQDNQHRGLNVLERKSKWKKMNIFTRK